MIISGSSLFSPMIFPSLYCIRLWAFLLTETVFIIRPEISIYSILADLFVIGCSTTK